MRKKVKLPNRKTLLNKLVDAWRFYIYARDNYTCQKCGKKKGEVTINAHHIVTKGSSGFAGKFDIDNGVTLCYYCHRHESGKYYVEFGDWNKAYLKNKGLDFYELKNKYSEVAGYKPTIDDLELKLKILTELLEGR